MSFHLTPFQTQALEALRSDRCHLIGVSPTGSGKSHVYEVEASRPETRMLLVTPLVALARQQARRLEARGVKVWGGHERTPSGGKSAMRSPSAWISSPESLDFELHAWRPNLLVVDECHCLWEWGRSFRPAFRKIPGLLQEYGIQRSIWLTATLPPPARAELKAALAPTVVELGGFDLPVGLEVEIRRCPWTDRPAALLMNVQSLRKRYGPQGIVFVIMRRAAEQVARLLRAHGLRVEFYHAGMAHEERLASEAKLILGECDVVVATSAFGMGMDYPGLAWSILWQAPLSLLSLAQSIGRVGRQGREAKAIVLWDPDDFKLVEWANPQDLKAVSDYLKDIECRRLGLKRYFNGLKGAVTALFRCGACDLCKS